MKTKTLIPEKYIPMDKSWIIRMGVLDILGGYTDIRVFLEKEKDLSDDLKALQRASRTWYSNKPIAVGESGTLYRLLQFASWKRGLNKKFIASGTLLKRKITKNPKIVKLSQKKLLALDNHTSQWATAAVLLGDNKRIKNPPYKLRLSYEAIKHWQLQRKKRESWKPRRDETIFHQAQTFALLLQGKHPLFIPRQAEDYCFARAFNFINEKEGKKKWPSLVGHESNRIVEMENAITLAKEGKKISSKDHRVVQAVALWAEVNKEKVTFAHPMAVNKSWPQFWDFLKWIRKDITQ